MKRWITMVFGLVLATGAVGAKAGTFNAGELLFAQPSWDYSPSAMIDLDGKEKVWWCGGNAGTDTVKYRERVPGGAWTEPQIVLRSNRVTPGATPIAWEGVFTCDPTVVRGNWTVGGISYGYAMYYTTNWPVDGRGNSVGVAFSTDGLHWNKWPDPVIHDADTSAYGTGQSVAWSSDGGSGVRTVYSYVDDSGVPAYFYREATDGIHFGPRRSISTAGLTLNGVPGVSHANPAIAFAPSVQNGHYYYYMANVCETYADSSFGPNFPEWGTAKGVCLYRAEGDDIFTGSWTRVLDSAHIKPVEVEPGFRTNLYGYLDQAKVNVYFGCSGDGEPSTWEICWAEGDFP